MRKSILLSFLCLLCVMVTHAATYELKSGEFDNSVTVNKPITFSSNHTETWTVTSSNTSLTNAYGRNSTTYAYFGSGKQSFTWLKLTSSSFPGVVKSVKVTAKVSATQAKLEPSVTVGGVSFTASKTGDLGTTQDLRTFTNGETGGSGDVVITFSGESGSKQLHLYAITIDYDPNGSTGGDKPAASVFKYGSTTLENSYTFTSSDGGIITATYDATATSHDCTIVPADAATKTDNGSGLYTINVSKNCTITVSATNSNGTTESALQVTVPEPQGEAPSAPLFFDSSMNSVSSTYAFDTTSGGTIIAKYETDGTTPSYTVTPSDACTVSQDASQGQYTFTVKKTCDITVKVANSYGENSSTLNVTVPTDTPTPGGNTFVRVTDGSTVGLGDLLVITNGTSGNSVASMSPTPRTSRGSIPQVSGAVTVVNNTTITVDTDKVAVFTVVKGKQNGYFALQYPSGEYLTVEANNSGFNSSKTLVDGADCTFNITSSATLITFRSTGRIIRAYDAGPDFRTYTSEANQKVYLYKLAAPKTDVTLKWAKDTYTIDTDFGWQGEEPSLSIVSPEGLTLEGLGIEYASDGTSVATVTAAGDRTLVVTPLTAGECNISAKVPDSNATHKSEAVSFLLKVTSAPQPTFTDNSDVAFTENSIELLPSALAAGYTFKVNAPEGYTLEVSSSVDNAATITYNADNTSATVTVTKACVITAKTKKGDAVSSRGVTFNIMKKNVEAANISWSAEFYVYDFATNQWKNEPSLFNYNNYPVTFTSSNPSVATIDANTGKVTPLVQGTTTLTAYVEGTDDYGTKTVTATVRVTDSTAPEGYDVFEMVRKGDQLRENEQFIIVTGEPYGTGTDKSYYAVSPYRHIDTTVRPYYQATAVEIPENGDGSTVLVKADANVLRLSKQYDTNATDTINSPFLFQVMNPDKDLDGDGKIYDGEPSYSDTEGAKHTERIHGRYIKVQKAKLFSFVDIPENIADRGTMNGNVRVLDPAVISGYEEKDYIGFTTTMGEFLNKGEVRFKGVADEEGNTEYIFRFNPVGNAIHFNLYAVDGTYDSKTHSKQSTHPVRIYRLAKRVEKPSITVYPAEPEPSDVAYQRGITFNNKVRVVVEKHPKTSASAQMMRTWQKIGHNPALPDYTSVNANKVTIFVDGNKVTAEDGSFIRYIDGPTYDANSATQTRTLFAVSQLEGVYSESAEATFKFKAAAPRLAKYGDEAADGSIKVSVSRPDVFTKDAKLYYTTDDTAPSVTFNEDGSVASFTGTAIDAPWSGSADDTNGIISLSQSETLMVGAFKAGYEPTIVEYSNLTVFPECRPMQLLRLTPAGRTAIGAESLMGSAYDATKDIYVNYRNDLVDASGNVADSNNHYHYLIQRDHTYGQDLNRHVTIKQISEEQFRKVFGPDNVNVAPEFARNFLWTSDYYVFALNTEDFKAQFDADIRDNVTIQNVTVQGPDKTYTALQNEVSLIPTNADGSYNGSTAKAYHFFGAMLENQGKLGAKNLTATVNYTAGGTAYSTSTEAQTDPKLPAPYGFTYAYEHEASDEAITVDGKDFVKFSVNSSIEGKPATEVIAPISEAKPRHLDLVFKFNRPNISDRILATYDIYYTIEFNRVEGEAVTKLPGSGVYVDNETNDENDDAVYRVRISDVNPMSAVNPGFKISQCMFVGNSGNEAYGTYAANFGAQEMEQVTPNNPARTDFKIGELWISKTPNRKVGDKFIADWMYVGHKDLNKTEDVIITNPDDTKVTLAPSFFHIETYLPDTEYYNSYEYLVKHDHTEPAADHPYFSDQNLGSANIDTQYDPLRYTIIARDFPCAADGSAITPNVAVAPVYLFAHSATMAPEPLSSTADGTGKASITKVSDAQTNAPAASQPEAKAPARAASTGAAPSTANYPMPHTGDTDMTHASIHDATVADSGLIMVKGGVYDANTDGPIMTGIDDIIGDNADGKALYFNLQGLPVLHPDHGIYIRVVNGHAEKIAK